MVREVKSIKKKIKYFTITVILIIVIVLLVCGYIQKVITVNYTESMDMIINPKQGLYVQVNSERHDKIIRLGEEGTQLILLACNLNGYQAIPISEDKLEEIQTAFALAREHNMQVIFRAAYGFSEGYLTEEADDTAILLQHMEQLAEIVNAYQDTILCVQAGMLGPWGEWHSSKFFVDDETSLFIRNMVALNWHILLEEGIQLQIRRPQYIQDAADAGIPMQRLGFHNDALLASESDMGTYRGSENARQESLEWIRENLSHSRTGGEMPVVSEYTDANNAVSEFHALGMTYLNQKYNEDVLESWKEQQYEGRNAYDYIISHLGNRLYISEVSMPTHILSLHNGKFTVTIKNTGFAEINEEIKCCLVIEQQDNMLFIPIEDVRKSQDQMILNVKASFAQLHKTEDDVQLGIWLGYGEPGEQCVYNLANESTYLENGIFYFAKYSSGLFLWKLEE